MRKLATMRQALADPALFGSVLGGASWAPWRALLIAMMGEALTDEERVHFTALTGREREPLELVDEFWGVIGRRGGKSRAMAVLAAYIAGLCDHADVLALGERGVIPILAATNRQATVIFGYVTALFEKVDVLAALVASPPTADTLSLTTHVDVEVRTASYRTVRSITAIAAIGDEAAFWRSDESANPDTEILNALRPALATTQGPLVVISSPYARKGEVYTTWKRHYGAAGDPSILVARGASRTLNPTLPQRVVDRAMERDPAAAAAEYMAEFRSDVETLLTVEAVDGVTVQDRRELPSRDGVRYFAFADPSGGSADSFTLAIAHTEGKTAVLDLVRERRPPFSPDGVTADYAATLKAYGVTKVTQDRYALGWTQERWRAHGIEALFSQLTASEVLGELLPMVNSGQVELLDEPRLRSQLIALERRTSRAGKDTISHPPGGHDDVAVSAAGALGLARRAALAPKIPFARPMIISGPGASPEGSAHPGRTYLPT